MKAVVLMNHGGPEMLRYGEAPDPTAGTGEILVDIHAASLNAADYKVRLGGSGYSIKFPHILGRDFSGVVSAVGASVTDLAIGDAVFGVTDQGIEGAYAERICHQGRARCQEARSAQSLRGSRHGADQSHRAVGGG